MSAHTTTTSDSAATGRVLLVGAGPGDPGLLTLRGRECLASADVVFYDYLASEALLRHAPPHAERHSLGRHGAGKLWTQEKINEQIVIEALAGKQVVRLKGGDPGIFGRLAEEVNACRAAGVPYEVVPGVTTAMAAGAFAGVTLTDRDTASCVALVTGHERPGKTADELLDFESMAKFPGTLVIYMGVTNAPIWSGQLIAGGKDPQTPVTLVRRCSLPDQTTIDCKLGELPEVLKQKKIRPPMIAIVGKVAAGRQAADWFVSRPLFGKTVLVTRPREQADEITRELTDLGAHVLLQPTIAISEPADWAPVDQAINQLAGYDFVVFSSRNGVRWFLDRMPTQGADARRFGNAKIAAIGPSTAAALSEWRLNADIVPDRYDAESLAESLADSVAGKRVLLVRASRGREVLAESLTASGAIVEQVVAYQSDDIKQLDPYIEAELTAGRIDWITATSSAIARSLIHMVEPVGWNGASVAAISPLTASVLGCKPKAVATDYTAAGMVASIVAAEQAE